MVDAGRHFGLVPEADQIPDRRLSLAARPCAGPRKQVRRIPASLDSANLPYRKLASIVQTCFAQAVEQVVEVLRPLVRFLRGMFQQ